MKPAAQKASSPPIGRRGTRKLFVVAPFALGLKPGIDPDKISLYADEMCDVEKLRKSLQ